jgi:hypothetical protein
MNKTAIEWLIEQWPKLEMDVPFYILDAAYQLEKSHMINFFTYGCMTQNDNITSDEILEQFRNYYDKQFNNA